MRSKKKNKAKVGRQFWKVKEKDDACKVIVPVEEFFKKSPDGKWRPKQGVAPRNIWKKVRDAAPGGSSSWEDGDIYIGHGSKWAEFNLVRK